MKEVLYGFNVITCLFSLVEPSFHRLSPHKWSQQSALVPSAAVGGPQSLPSVQGGPEEQRSGEA